MTTPNTAGKPSRKIIDLPKANGLFVDSGVYDEVQETHIRDTFAQMFHYADRWQGNPRTYDPAGNYLCGDCNKFNTGACLAVEGPISPDHGSCEHWENKDAGDSELKFAQKLTHIQADYGVTPALGWGCFRCRWSSVAKAPDSHGRPLFCGQGGMRVEEHSCCGLNKARKIGATAAPIELEYDRMATNLAKSRRAR